MKLSLFHDALGREVFIPVLNYEKGAGPKILLTCLAHGNEVIGLEAALQFLDFAKGNPNFKGHIVVLSCLNFSGFVEVDRLFRAENFNLTAHSQNLNRVYGQGGAALTNRVGSKILDFIKSERPDFVIDCHSYCSQSLVHLILDRPGGKLEDSLIDVAKRSCIPFYLEYDAGTVKEQQLDGSLSNQLCLAGIAAVTVELGPKRGFSLSQGLLAASSLINLGSTLGAFGDGAVVDDLFMKQAAQIPKDQIFYRQPIINDSNFSGYFRPLVEVGQLVRNGERIAEVVDLNGKAVHQIVAKGEGFVATLEDEAYTYPWRQIGNWLVRV